MKTQPTPLKVKVTRTPEGLAVVDLTFKKPEAEGCSRCDLCLAKPARAKGRVTCTNTMPAAAVEGFVWGTGSRVARAMAALTPPTTETPPAKPQKSRRRRPAKTVDQLAAELRRAMAAEAAADAAPDPCPDDPEASDAENARRIDHTLGTAKLLGQAVLMAHPDFDMEGYEAAGIETEDHHVLTIPAGAFELLGPDGTITIAVPKSKIHKAAEVEAE